MARSRGIKPGFYKNEELAECSVWARFIFPGLWMLADREGKLEDRPKRIKGEILPFDTTDVDPLLDELASRGFILRYAVGTEKYIKIIAFIKHQNPHFREQASTIPDPKSPGLCANSIDNKPEALHSFDDAQALDKPEASPSFSSVKPTLNDPKATLTPSSLTTAYPIPSSKTKTPRASKKTAKSVPPAEWKPSEKTASTLSTEFALPPDGIARYTTAFLDQCAAKGYEYADFDAAFRNCVRQDWPRFRINGAVRAPGKTAAQLIDEEEAKRAVPSPSNPQTAPKPAPAKRSHSDPF